MKKLALWFLLLNKRLYKKITYLGMLLLIPLFVIVFNMAAQEPSGVVTIALGVEKDHDTVTAQIVEQLKDDAIVISFVEATPERAEELVQAGKADAAWIFPGDMQERVQVYASDAEDNGGFVRVIEREQTTVLRLAREKLSGAVFTQIAEEMYLIRVRNNLPELAERSDEELLAYLETTVVSGELFAFYDIYGNRREASGNYLTAPLRGMLAVLATVSAVVTAMYYQKDEERGIFSLLPERHRVLGEMGYQLISAINMMVLVCIALIFAGLNVMLWQEILLLILFSLCCSLFGMAMRTIFGGGRLLAVLIPVLALVMMVVCPVFFDIADVRQLQFFFPPTYYISGAYNYSYLLYMLLYCLVLAAICLGGRYIRSNISRMMKHGKRR